MGLIRTEIQTYLGKRGRKVKVSYDISLCDDCGSEIVQRTCIAKDRRKKKLAAGNDLCLPCSKLRSDKHIAAVGTEALGRLSKEERVKNASIGGTAASKSLKPNSSKFTTERWNAKTDEEKLAQVMKASNALQEKLKDPVYAAQHFAKVMRQKALGYMSRGHISLHDSIKGLGFSSHVQIGAMQVDECNEALKIVVEYNGDMWHCNPRNWKAEDYNTAIRMTAGEKWQKDIARHKMLRSMGYKTLIVWESEWIKDAQTYISRIRETCDEACKHKDHT